MADSLDDFFAKKDKKRGKDKGKAAFSAGALVKELEEGSRQTDYPVRKDVKTSTAIELLGLDADDADWRDFEDVEKRDYTGLKVKEMSLQDQNEEEQRRSQAEVEQVPESTPWKMKDETLASSSNTADSTTNAKQAVADVATKPESSDSNQATSSKDEASAAAPTTAGKTDSDGKPAAIDSSKTGSNSASTTEKTSDTQSAKKAYVPPAQRNQRASDGEFKVLEPTKMSAARSTGSRRAVEINIKDESAFPSLG